MQRLKVTHKIKLHLILATINNIVPFVLELDHKAVNPTRVIESQDCHFTQAQIYLKPGCTSSMSYFHFIGSEKQSQLRSFASSTFLDQLTLQIFLVNNGDTRWYGHNFNQSSSGKVTQ